MPAFIQVLSVRQPSHKLTSCISGVFSPPQSNPTIISPTVWHSDEHVHPLGFTQVIVQSGNTVFSACFEVRVHMLVMHLQSSSVVGEAQLSFHWVFGIQASPHWVHSISELHAAVVIIVHDRNIIIKTKSSISLFFMILKRTNRFK